MSVIEEARLNAASNLADLINNAPPDGEHITRPADCFPVIDAIVDYAGTAIVHRLAQILDTKPNASRT